MPSDWNETVLAMFHDELERLGLQGEYADASAMPSPEVIRKAMELGNSDTLIVTAVDPYGVGFYLSLHLPEVTTLTEKERARWKMLAAHLAAGFRLRHGLSDDGVLR